MHPISGANMQTGGLSYNLEETMLGNTIPSNAKLIMHLAIKMRRVLEEQIVSIEIWYSLGSLEICLDF